MGNLSTWPGPAQLASGSSQTKTVTENHNRSKRRKRVCGMPKPSGSIYTTQFLQSSGNITQMGQKDRKSQGFSCLGRSDTKGSFNVCCVPWCPSPPCLHGSFVAFGSRPPS